MALRYGKVGCWRGQFFSGCNGWEHPRRWAELLSRVQWAGRVADVAGAAERIVHDGADGARATPALRAAAEATIDLAGGARRGHVHGLAHLRVGQDVAGADDHCFPRRTLEPL